MVRDRRDARRGSRVWDVPAWSYALSIKNHTVRSWIQYNALYVGILFGLGITSLIMFSSPSQLFPRC